MTGAAAPLLRVVDLKKSFPIERGIFRRAVGSIKAVDGVSFTLERGKTLSLVGESGCGKTTTGRCVVRLMEADSGEIWLQGEDVRALGRAALRQRRRRMQVIFQDPYSSLNPRKTVGEIIAGPMALHGLIKKPQMDEHAKYWLDKVGLQPSYVGRYPHEFSGGQRQRIGVARAVCLRPDFVVCDEAVSALDVSVQAQVINLLLDLKEELSLSYLFIAHDMAVVRHISDEVAVMYLGRVVEWAPCAELFARPYHPYTQILLSAVPKLHPARTTRRVRVTGDVPSPASPPAGCHFHPRCPLAHERCRVEAPRLRAVGSGHTVACHLYETQNEAVDATLK